LTAIEQAQNLQAQAIAILLAEREQIDAHLQRLGYGEIKTTYPKKRGRPRKDIEITPQAE
jgi:hypothetical protein